MPLQRRTLPPAAILAAALLVLLPGPAGAAMRRIPGHGPHHGMYAFRVPFSPVADAAALTDGHARARVVRRLRGGTVYLRPAGPLRHCRHARCRLWLVLRTQQPTAGPVAGPCVFGSFGPWAWPGACWRPYSDSSPFNRPLPTNPRTAVNSAQIVATIASWGKPAGYLTTRGAESEIDYEHPYYFSRPSDPLFTIHCVKDWGRCPVEGAQLRIPDAARQANGPDGHMAVIDQSQGFEYDFWQVLHKPAGGGTLDISWGGHTRIDGDGLDGGGTASGFGLLAGIIRAPEWTAGDIRHALFITVRCDSGRFVYPAGNSGTSCPVTSGAPAMGQHLRLALSDAQIDALGAPVWETTILRAMAHYGMFVGDTGGEPWNLEFESDETYTSFGAAPEVRSAFEAFGARHYQDATYNTYNLDLVPVHWARYLQVVDPCVDAGTC